VGGYEDRRDHRQDLHHLVHPVARARQVDVEHSDQRITQALGGLGDLDDVVVDVAEEHLPSRTHQRAASPTKMADYLAHRSHGVADRGDLRSKAVDRAQRLRLGLLDDRLLDVLDARPDRLKRAEVAVHDRVEQGIEEVVRARLAHLAEAGPKALAHRIEERPGHLLKAQQYRRAQNEADLAGREAVTGRIKDAADAEEILVELVDLGAVSGVKQVLEDEWVQAEALPHGAHRLNLAQPRHRDPRYAFRRGRALARVGQFVLIELVAVVDRHVNPRGLGMVLPHVHECAGGSASFL
jgi:hypothetical protein